MRPSVLLVLIIFMIPLLHSCMTAPKTVKRGDPLIGKLIDTTNGNRVTFNDLIDRIKDIDVIYLSEKHDNEGQHKFQEKVIQALIDKKIAPVLGFEFFSMNGTPHILNFLDSGKVTIYSAKDEKFIEKDLKKKLGWDNQSDTMWKYYFTLLNFARKNGIDAAGLDLDSVLKRRITRKGLEGITALERHQMFKSGFINETYKNHMFAIFKDVHCGMGHTKMQARLYDTWIARNDKIAHSIVQLVTVNPKRPVVVIIGGGHTEYNLGVIDRVRDLNPVITQVNIGLKEISVSPLKLSDYLDLLDLEGFKPVPPCDFIRFFQRVDYKDPCEKFRKSLEKMKKKK
jgi:uncharacterized iron-regulated protein